jgi:hypothetical protein
MHFYSRSLRGCVTSPLLHALLLRKRLVRVGGGGIGHRADLPGAASPFPDITAAVKTRNRYLSAKTGIVSHVRDRIACKPPCPRVRGQCLAEVALTSAGRDPRLQAPDRGHALAPSTAGAAEVSGGKGAAGRNRENRLGERNTNLRSFPPSHAATADGCVVKHKIECIGNSDGTFQLSGRRPGRIG